MGAMRSASSAGGLPAALAGMVLLASFALWTLLTIGGIDTSTIVGSAIVAAIGVTLTFAVVGVRPGRA
ncbi:MAG TPA: hypothetical protein VNS80_08320 [Pseudolysinimonas sp.]|nr:hypothetical protein [Pseudolysinimonas sp.]